QVVQPARFRRQIGLDRVRQHFEPRSIRQSVGQTVGGDAVSGFHHPPGIAPP
ncbi:hypothetical protein OY671_010951, partial [Metschnikowia pulcherrima]